jgi:hypothetical protein
MSLEEKKQKKNGKILREEEGRGQWREGKIQRYLRVRKQSQNGTIIIIIVG